MIKKILPILMFFSFIAIQLQGSNDFVMDKHEKVIIIADKSAMHQGAFDKQKDKIKQELAVIYGAYFPNVELIVSRDSVQIDSIFYNTKNVIASYSFWYPGALRQNCFGPPSPTWRLYYQVEMIKNGEKMPTYIFTDVKSNQELGKQVFEIFTKTPKQKSKLEHILIERTSNENWYSTYFQYLNDTYKKENITELHSGLTVKKYLKYQEQQGENKKYTLIITKGKRSAKYIDLKTHQLIKEEIIP